MLLIVQVQICRNLRDILFQNSIQAKTVAEALLRHIAECIMLTLT